MKNRRDERLTKQKNKLYELFDQLDYLRDQEKADQKALNRAENKLKSASSIIDMKQADRKLKEAECLLDAQERVVQMT